MASSHDSSGIETTEVIICGCGPTGAMLAVSLGHAGVANIVLEKEAAITTDPRGIALDEDGIRALQAAGVYDKVFTEIGRGLGIFNFVSGTQHDLSKRAFTRIDYSTTEGGTGHVGFLCHKQPVLEASLRNVQARLPACQLRSSCTITSISEDEEYVYATYEDKGGFSHKLRARFLVGADGKTGFTRKKYLEPRGIKMEQASLSHYEETWVAMNWKIRLPTPETHPNFPLWRLGYSPQQVFDAFFPPDFYFLCNPERPAVCGRFGPPEERLWRFEYVVQDGEDTKEACRPETIEKIVHPYIKHAGSRYGLPHDVEFPLDCVETLRVSPFLFSARSCNKWALGRVILCGDSAHVFPPFGGQGIASGFRDATSLSWYLEACCNLGKTNYTHLLESWYTERKQQLERSIAATVANGRFVTARNPWKIFLRDTYLWLIQMVPSWRRELEKGPRAEGMAKYDYRDGMVFLPDMRGGGLFPQVYCAQLSGTGSQVNIGFSDDFIFRSETQGLFQLVVLLESPDQMSCLPELSGLDQWSGGQVLASEATCIIQDTGADLQKYQTRAQAHSATIVRVATGDEFAASSLCTNRPAPKYYDPYQMRAESYGNRFILLRKDKFVFALCDTVAELRVAVGKIVPILEGGDH